MTNQNYKIKNTTWLGVLAYLLIFFAILGICFILGFQFTESPKTVFVITGLGVILAMTIPFYIGIKLIRVEAVPPQPFIGKEKTIEKITSHNSPEIPLSIQETNKYDLLLSYKLLDAKWQGILFRGGIKEDYKLYIKLDELNKTAYVVEHTRSLRWGASTDGSTFNLHFSFNLFYGVVLFSAQQIKIYDPFQFFKKAADLKYNLADAKNPLFKLLLDCGWTIKPKYLPIQVRK